ncbi:synaptonemal complex central element protein 2 [Betta splendens]|uniref:Synaptonemal complex central element protein 2 n=1 Tax=Betta splendens TaxID=158456 RepID=A0A6P7NB67_BETSP|nr:synaptonemal complex central element protein 2 [Betta splendens]
MDFFSEVPSPSPDRSSHSIAHEDLQMTEDTDDDLLRGASSSGSMAELQGQCSRYRITCSSKIEVISRTVQELVQQINSSRASNEKVMDDFQEKLVAKVTEKCQLLKERMYMVYENNSNEMEVKMQELYEVLERCTKINNELLEANRALASLREGLPIGPTSQSP